MAIDDAIDTIITGGPQGPTNDNTPTFTFEANPAAGASFVCALDGSPAGPCTSPFTPAPLADGFYAFTVTASSPAGTDVPGTEVEFRPVRVESAETAAITADAHGADTRGGALDAD